MLGITAFILCLTSQFAGVVDTWIDPYFKDAVKRAELIAFGSATDALEKTVIKFRCDEVLAGNEKAGAVVSIRRLRSDRHATPCPSKGEQVLVIVLKDKGDYKAFSPTYWVWPRNEDIVHIPIRDPFSMMSLGVSDLRNLVKFLRSPKPDAKELKKFLGDLIARLAKTVVQADKLPQVETQVLALEALHFFGSKQHVDKATPYLASPWFHVRLSAVRALQGCGTSKADAALMAHLDSEKQVIVQSELGRALFGRVAKEERARILEAAKRASAEIILLSGRLMDPIMNSLPAPRFSLGAVVLRIDGEKKDYFQCCRLAEESWDQLIKKK